MNQSTSLVRRRLEQGLTRRAMSKKIGVSAAQVGHYESGRNLPQAGRIAKVAEAYELSIKDFLSAERS